MFDRDSAQQGQERKTKAIDVLEEFTPSFFFYQIVRKRGGERLKSYTRFLDCSGACLPFLALRPFLLGGTAVNFKAIEIRSTMAIKKPALSL